MKRSYLHSDQSFSELLQLWLIHFNKPFLSYQDYKEFISDNQK